MRNSILLPLTLLLACGNNLNDPAFPTGSQTIIGTADQNADSTAEMRLVFPDPTADPEPA